jgi:hypothetical protein
VEVETITTEKFHFIVSCKGGNGTTHMMKIKRETGIPVLEIDE